MTSICLFWGDCTEHPLSVAEVLSVYKVLGTCLVGMVRIQLLYLRGFVLVWNWREEVKNLRNKGGVKEQ